MSRETIIHILGVLKAAGFFIVMAMCLVELDGYQRAEKRAKLMEQEYAFRGEAVPEEIVPLRNLIPAAWRGRMGLTGRVAFAVFIVALVAGYIVK